jgi:hypothetical protein
MTERELQKQCLEYLRARSVRYSRTENGHKGRNLHGRIGEPDITCFPGYGYVVFFELKTATGKQRPEQVEFQRWAEANHYRYFVVRTFEHFQNLMDTLIDHRQHFPITIAGDDIITP